MVIPDSFKQAYNSTKLVWEVIQDEADGILRNIANQHQSTKYYSRIKCLESVFSKSQKGEYENPLWEMEDFFAGTIVVPTLAIIEPVRDEIAQQFAVTELVTKPPDPYEFRYRDLHLLLSLKDSPLRADKTVLGLKFEIQLKTFLQSAWSQASHDIIYKPSTISWGVERIAGELRALLELSDNVLAQIEGTAQLLHSQAEEKYTGYKADTRKIIKIAEEHWKSSELPLNRRRMAQVVRNYKDMAGITSDELDTIVQDAKEAKDKVFDFRTITPTQKIFILVFQKYPDKVKRKLLQKSSKFRILITPEMADFYPELSQLDNELSHLDRSRIKVGDQIGETPRV